MKKIYILSLHFLLIFSLLSCNKETSNTEKLYQVSTLQSLMVGQYDGEITAKTLKKYWDIGLGTFDWLDGEMIIIDGKIYKAKIDGTVSEVEEDEKIPFANITYLDGSSEKKWSFTGGYENLEKFLNTQFPEKNFPVVFFIEGNFSNIQYRSVPEQKKPYPPLTSIVPDKQRIFSQENIHGTLVWFRFPDFMNGINATGYHLHFISDDRTRGWHLLKVKSGDITVKGKTLHELHVIFPENMKNLDLSVSEKDIEIVEKNTH